MTVVRCWLLYDVSRRPRRLEMFRDHRSFFRPDLVVMRRLELMVGRRASSLPGAVAGPLQNGVEGGENAERWKDRQATVGQVLLGMIRSGS